MFKAPFFALLWALVKDSEPSMPFSSLSKNTKQTFPRSASGMRRAVSSRVTTPLVLSLAVCRLAGPSMIHQTNSRLRAMAVKGISSSRARDRSTAATARSAPSAAATARNRGITSSSW